MRAIILALLLAPAARASDMNQGGGSSTPGISTGAATTAALTGNGNASTPLSINSSSVPVYDINRNLTVPYGVVAPTMTATTGLAVGIAYASKCATCTVQVVSLPGHGVDIVGNFVVNGSSVLVARTQTTGTGVDLTTETASNYSYSNAIDLTIISTIIPCGFGTGIASVTLVIPTTLSTGPWTWGWSVYGVSSTTGTPSIYFDHQNSGTHYSWNSNNANANGPASGTNRSWCVLTSSSTSGTYSQRFQMEANGQHEYTGTFGANKRDPSKISVSWIASVVQSSLGTWSSDGIWGSCHYDGPGTTTSPSAITFAEPPTTLGQPTWCGEAWIKRVGK